MSDSGDLQNQMKLEEADFIASVAWLYKKLKVEAFSRETLYLLRQLSFHYDLDGRYGELAGIDQEEIILLVKEQIAQEKKEEVDRRNNLKATLLEAAEGDEEKQRLGQIWSEVTASQHQRNDESAEEKQLIDDPRKAEPIPVELELFSLQEREGIKAIAAFQSVLYGALPHVSAFREQYLPAELLSATEALQFLKSPAVRFLSLSEFEKLGVSVLEHKASIVSRFTGKPTLEQIDRLSGEIIYDPPASSPHSNSHSAAEEGLRRWYRYTVTIELTSGKTLHKTHHNDRHSIETQITEKTLIVADNKPYSRFSDPFFKEDSSKLFNGMDFAQWFPTSVADQLYQLITSRGAMASLPGDVLEKAIFVLTGTLSYSPVTAYRANRIVPNINHPDAGAKIAARMQYGQGLSGHVAIEAEAWITSETIRKIYQKQQSLLAEAAEGNTRYKICKADSLHLVSEVINIYLTEKVAPSYQHAYELLRQAGKIKGTADNFRKKYKRACEILSVPFSIEDVVRYMRKRS